MSSPLDIIIPTCRPPAEVAPLITEIRATAGIEVRIKATCQDLCAAKNRNIGLDWARSAIIIQVDDDTRNFPDGWAKRLTEILLSHPECVMVSARLMAPNGQPGFMMGNASLTGDVSTAVDRRLPTACVAFWNTDQRFDIDLIGSGFEDNCWAAEVRERNPDAVFLVANEVRVTHLNEQKNQGGDFWNHNKQVYEAKWPRG